MGFFSRLFEGMKKTKKSFAEKLKYIFTGNDIDEDFYEELEYVLISADMGVEATEVILEELRDVVKKNKLKTTDDCKEALKQIMIDLLEGTPAEPLGKPCVIMVLGVNGVGKTTTIGKLAKKYTDEGKNVVLAAADTFRAAASDQLEVWANRSKVKIVTNEHGVDPAAVVYDAIASAKARNADILLIDTAGRLHNKAILMEELKKISRVVNKEWPEAEYHKMVVVDGTTGQNANSQVELFNEAVELTDITITKLDGTSKGGFLVSLAQNFDIAIRYVGVGETAEDLLDFDAKEFIEAIF
ncbi:MAG: signal recognition particle-docking protein FtsY [Clostridia bacterium]|nr:signal recognition particle-docking protein FtsY [Clostridia bacterium]